MRLEHLLSGEDAVSTPLILKVWAGATVVGWGTHPESSGGSQFAVPFFLYASVSVFRYNEGERGWAPARQTLACQSYSSVG